MDRCNQNFCWIQMIINRLEISHCFLFSRSPNISSPWWTWWSYGSRCWCHPETSSPRISVDGMVQLTNTINWWLYRLVNRLFRILQFKWNLNEKFSALDWIVNPNGLTGRRVAFNFKCTEVNQIRVSWLRLCLLWW